MIHWRGAHGIAMWITKFESILAWATKLKQMTSEGGQMKWNWTRPMFQNMIVSEASEMKEC